MKVSLGISTALLAVASMVAPVGAQQAGPGAPTPPPPPGAPRARTAQAIVIQKSAGGYLGIGGVEVTPERVKALNLKEERGVEVSSVTEDGPAAKAGIKAGDVVLEFNGTPVQGTVQFQRMVSETPPGRQVKLTVWRNSALQTVVATIGERKNTMTSMMPEEGARAWTFEVPDGAGFPRMPEMNIPHFETISPSPVLGIYGEPLGEND